MTIVVDSTGDAMALEEFRVHVLLCVNYVLSRTSLACDERMMLLLLTVTPVWV
jgi:hypothetical protein